jgi:putative flavoprotein involved in K+ transport
MLDVSADAQVAELVDGFGKALEAGDIEGALAYFQYDCYWRDLVSFTWNIKTMEGKDEIADMLRHQLGPVRPSRWRLAEGEAVTREDGVTTAWIAFETGVARGYGLIRLKDGKIWTLLTTMAELKGFEEPLGFDRPLGAKHGSGKRRPSWKEEREAEASELGYARQPEVVIVGGGQAGIALGARLRQLGVPTIIVEKNERAGDSWRNRYKSLCLHDPVWYDHLPYMPFPPNWPVFAPKDKIGDWLEMYARIMELNYWTRTSCLSASYDEAAGEWTVVVDRDGAEVTLRPKQLVLAIGMSGRPIEPDFPGRETFRGEQHHSARHPGPDGWAGKKAVVIGSNNSAHDICAALWENDADVTMVQRTPTTVVRSETLMELDLGPLYSEEALRRGITTDKADLLAAAKPYRILHEGHIRLSERIRERDRDLYEGLAKAGFRIDWGDDGSGLGMKFLRRFSGY